MSHMQWVKVGAAMWVKVDAAMWVVWGLAGVVYMGHGRGCGPLREDRGVYVVRQAECLGCMELTGLKAISCRCPLTLA